MSIARFELTFNSNNRWDLEVIDRDSTRRLDNIPSLEDAALQAQSLCYHKYGRDILFDVVKSTNEHIIYEVYAPASCKSA